MSAQWRADGQTDRQTGLCLRAMAIGDLDQVMAVETACYAFPWTRGNFIDSLAAGYEAHVLCAAEGRMLGYFIAMPGVDEMHLLNITVAPGAQGRGHASLLIGALKDLCRAQGAAQLWLEVRQSNTRALAIYRHVGFVAVGSRKGYYPAPFGRREDAVVMSLAIDARADTNDGANDALG